MSNQPSWFCPSCGHQNQLNFKHCTECGTMLPPGAATSQTPIQQLPKRSSSFSFFWLALIGCVVFGFLCAVFFAANNPDTPSKENRNNVMPSPFQTTRKAENVELARPSTGVTMANYNRLQTGMTYSEVVAILGKEGVELSSNDIGGYRTIMYQWQGKGISGMSVMFQNGRMIQKSQIGLE